MTGTATTSNRAWTSHCSLWGRCAHQGARAKKHDFALVAHTDSGAWIRCEAPGIVELMNAHLYRCMIRYTTHRLIDHLGLLENILIQLMRGLNLFDRLFQELVLCTFALLHPSQTLHGLRKEYKCVRTTYKCDKNPCWKLWKMPLVAHLARHLFEIQNFQRLQVVDGKHPACPTWHQYLHESWMCKKYVTSTNLPY